MDQPTDCLSRRLVPLHFHSWRIGDIQRDIEAFGDAVRRTAKSCAVEIQSQEPDAILAALQTQLELAALMSERAKNLSTRIDEAEEQGRVANEKITAAKASLKPLLDATGAALEDLRGAIGKVDEGRAKRARIGTLTEEIMTVGDGLSLEQLTDECTGKDAGALVSESGKLNEELKQLASDIEELAERKRGAELEFHEGDDREDAALAAANQALARSEMEVQAEAYLRKRAEKELLQWTINKYREEKQAPLLQRATEIFSTLTLGKYVALSVDIEGDKPVLYAIEKGRVSVVPASRLSDGTIDQLYLALRLAAVEEAVAAGLKLPFLADDLFINYDNPRAAAGFQVLAELAEKTQVLFFTHNDQLVDLAKKAVHPVVISSCQIGLQSEAA